MLIFFSVYKLHKCEHDIYNSQLSQINCKLMYAFLKIGSPGSTMSIYKDINVNINSLTLLCGHMCFFFFLSFCLKFLFRNHMRTILFICNET